MAGLFTFMDTILTKQTAKWLKEKRALTPTTYLTPVESVAENSYTELPKYSNEVKRGQ